MSGGDNLVEYSDLDERCQILHLIFEKEWGDLRRIMPKKNVDIPQKYDTEHENSQKAKEGGVWKTVNKNLSAEGMDILDILVRLDHFRKLKTEAKRQLKKNHHIELENVLKKLDRTLFTMEEDLDILFRKYAHHIVDYCEYSDVVTNIAKCIEFQERTDKINELEMGNNSKKIKLKDIFFNELKNSIECSFNFKDPSGKGQIPLDEQLRIVENQGKSIQKIDSFVVPFFPREFKITEFCVRTLYVSTIVWMKLKTADEIHFFDDFEEEEKEEEEEEDGEGEEKKPTKDISKIPLILIQWIQNEYPQLFKPYETRKYIDFDPLDGLKQSLLDSHIRSFSNSMNPQKKVLGIFSSLSPEAAEKEHPHKELFDWINKNIQPAIDLRLGDVLFSMMKVSQEKVISYAHTLSNEMKKFMERSEMDDIIGISQFFIPYFNDFSKLKLFLKQKKNEVLEIGIISEEEKDLLPKVSITLNNLINECFKILVDSIKIRMSYQLRKLFQNGWASQTIDEFGVTQDIVVQLVYLLDDLSGLDTSHNNNYFDLKEFVIREYIRRFYFSKRKFGMNEINIMQEIDFVNLRYEFLDIPDKFEALEMIRKLMVCEEIDCCDLIEKQILKKFPDFPGKLMLETIKKSKVIKNKQKNIKLVKKNYMKKKTKKKNKKEEEEEEDDDDDDDVINNTITTLFSRIDLDKNPNEEFLIEDEEEEE